MEKLLCNCMILAFGDIRACFSPTENSECAPRSSISGFGIKCCRCSWVVVRWDVSSAQEDLFSGVSYVSPRLFNLLQHSNDLHHHSFSSCPECALVTIDCCPHNLLLLLRRKALLSTIIEIPSALSSLRCTSCLLDVGQHCQRSFPQPPKLLK